MPRGEQRAMLLLSLLVILVLGVRMGVQMLPAREPSGMEAFREEAIAILATNKEADYLRLKVASQKSKARYRAISQPDPSTQKKWVPFDISPVNLNGADSVALLPLPGIGPVFAGRIIKYRNLLGGFVSPEQLMEVYGMEGATVDLITSSLYIDSLLLRKLNLNSASFRDLLRHPYLEYEDVKAIVNYRDVLGHISTLDELYQNMILPDSILEKFAPYLELSIDH